MLTKIMHKLFGDQTKRERMTRDSKAKVRFRTQQATNKATGEFPRIF